MTMSQVLGNNNTCKHGTRPRIACDVCYPHDPDAKPKPISPKLDHGITEDHKRVNLKWLRRSGRGR